MPWPRGPRAQFPDPGTPPPYFRGGRILLVAAAVGECVLVADQTGRCCWVPALGLRHLGAAPGDADTRSIYLFPLLPRLTRARLSATTV